MQPLALEELAIAEQDNFAWLEPGEAMKQQSWDTLIVMKHFQRRQDRKTPSNIDPFFRTQSIGHPFRAFKETLKGEPLKCFACGSSCDARG